MTSKRPYKETVDTSDALEELIKHKGSQFDEELLDIFVSMIRNGTRK